jgi:hypothetical protein
MKKALFILLLSVFCFSFISFAQTIETEISDLSEGADIILTGKVINQESDWNTRKSAIFTRVTIQVEEFIKGNNSENIITVIHPGGEIGDIGELYTHTPSFESNENILLFAKKNYGTRDYIVYEGEIGKITLYDDKDGNLVTSQRKKLSTLRDEIKSLISVK